MNLGIIEVFSVCLQDGVRMFTKGKPLFQFHTLCKKALIYQG